MSDMRTLRLFILVTDSLFVAYWLLTSLVAAGLVDVPTAWLFKNYHDLRVIAWNWSFLPLDLAFAVTGYASLYLERRGDPAWRPMAIISLTLTFCAGLMAVSYWTILGEFDPAWFLPNLALAIWPLFFVRQLVCPAARLPV